MPDCSQLEWVIELSEWFKVVVWWGLRQKVLASFPLDVCSVSKCIRCRLGLKWPLLAHFVPASVVSGAGLVSPERSVE